MSPKTPRPSPLSLRASLALGPDQLPRSIAAEFRHVLASLCHVRRFDPRLRPDVIEDLQQELLLDYFENRSLVETLSEDERCERWMRLVGREHYRICERLQRLVEPDSEPDACVGPGSSEIESLEPWRACEHVAPRCIAAAQAIVQNGTSFRNGRINARATARALRCPQRSVRAKVRELCDALGRGREHVQFWSWRLAEKLLGLAADLLRDGSLVRVHAECVRRRPDPSGRRRGIARARRMLNACALPPTVASVKGLTTPARLERCSPLDLLAYAELLWPENPAIALWTFEAACASRDYRRAVRALRTARRLGADRVPLVLARARLHEMRGREHAARRLLARAARLHPRDERILRSLEALR